MHKYQTLGDVMGSLRYMGSCPRCHAQFMSTHERVAITRVGRIICEKCAKEREDRHISRDG